MLIADVMPSPMVVSDLSWFLCEVDGSMGLRSTFGAQLDRARVGLGKDHGGSPVEAENFMDERIKAVERERRIGPRFFALTKAHQATLCAAYGPVPPQWKGDEWRWLGTPTTPVPLVLLAAKRRGVSMAKLQSWKGTEQGKRPLLDLRNEAMLALVGAAHAYEDKARERPGQGHIRRRPW